MSMKDPAVQWLEQPYDHWTLVEGANFDGLKVLMIRDGHGWLRNSSYSQPMFHIKHDAAGAGYSNCYRCEANAQHTCSECGISTTHMEGFICQRCWLKGSGSDLNVEPWTEEER